MASKVCSWPKCKKEVYDKKSLFCGEHKRQSKDLTEKSLKTAAAAGGFLILAAGSIKKLLK